MAGGGFPNKNRASNAYDAYGDAMRPYVARVLENAHGPDWIRLRLLSDDLRENNRRRYDEIRQALQAKKPLEETVDRADIPNLVNGDRENFPGLNRDEIRNLFTIRGLRNAIVHSGRGDCTVEEANAIISLCVLILERCGLSDAAENVRGLSLEAATGVAEVSEAELRQQRERREWDKARLADKSPEELTPWEQQRLAEIEWEEEWERRELVRREREEVARFGDDIDGLRLWFDADEARHDRHPAEHAALLQREQEQREQREERERREIAQFDNDIDGLRLWFDADEARHDHHPAAYATLIQREQERYERERSEIAAFGDDLDGLRRWFHTDNIRRKQHLDEYTALHRREQERRERRERERQERERRERELRERERAEIAAFGDDLEGLRRWFDTYKVRPKRHPSEYAALLRREEERAKQEHERSEIAAFGDDTRELRRWFNTYKTRRNHHPSEYAALLQREQEEHERAWREMELQEQQRREGEQRERERKAAVQERERAEIAAFGNDIDGLRRWFNAVPARTGRHSFERAALIQRERERAEIAALGNDLNGLRSWFNADTGRQQRHSDEYATLEQSERSLFSRIFRRR